MNNEGLYGLKNDFAETKNVIAEYPKIVEQLRARYDKWWIKVQLRLDNEDTKHYEQTKGKKKASSNEKQKVKNEEEW